MASPVSPEDADITELEFQNLSPVNSPRPISPTSSTTESFQTALSDTDRAFIRFLKRRMRRALLRSYYERIKAKFPETWIGKLTFFLCGFTAVFLVYEMFAIKRPTLAASVSQGLAAEAATAAAQWTAYSTWKNSICPAELVRNISSPECEKVKNQPTPPPPKPRYPEESSLSHQLARRLVPFFNASYILEKEIDASDNHCRIIVDTALAIQQPMCSSIEAHAIFHKRWSNSETRLSLSKFPLPSKSNLHSLKRWTANLPPVTYGFVIWLGTFDVTLLLAAAIHRKWGWSIAERRWWHVLFLCNVAVLGECFRVWMWHLTRFMAKDQFLSTCISQKTSRVEISEACAHLFKRSSTLSSETEIRLWSIWQGYLFAKISEFSTDNFIFTSILVAQVLGLHYLGSKCLRGIRAMWSRRDYLPIATEASDNGLRQNKAACGKK
ncbi:hypothetical protein DM02DRAFT_651849 [Periconia macrospinosa]|uniref:Uncharacterized protein n=1 Tax=Periconia macrospinosa TaxID=97972 RepID=A0A2V1E146_9PLEO|nr:hypothetical protein DM02DRAFT_651849 [Periconia macrospinosa]